MQRNRSLVVLGAGASVAFLVTVAVLLRIIPRPLSHLDYLVIGAAATFGSMLVLFVTLITTTGSASEAFFKGRQRDHRR